MANEHALTSQKLAIPTLEQFKGIKHGNTVVGTSAIQVPATNLNYRKGIILQNKHATNVVYIGGGIPYMIEGHRGRGTAYTDDDHDKRALVWRLSTGGTNEWYLVTAADGDPGLSEITYFYYTIDGTETLGTAGTVGSLGAQHNWDWVDGDTLGFSTLYVRSDGAVAANSPSKIYDDLFAYYFVLTADDVAATGGVELGPRDSVHVTADGSVKIFAIASGATTAVGHLEVT